MRRFPLVLISLFITINAAAAIRTWTGATNAFWSVPTNWDGAAPVSGDHLVFQLVPPNKATINDLPPNTLIGGIFVSSLNYSISGNAIDLESGPFGASLAYVTFDVFTINVPIRLVGSQMWSTIGGSIHVNGAVDLNGNTLTLDNGGGPGGIIFGPIGGTGMLIIQTGQWTLSSNSTFSGSVLVDGGMLTLGVSNALPAAVPITLNGPLNLNGMTQTIGSLTGGSAVKLGGGTLTIAGGSTTYGGVIQETGTVIHSGGTLTLQGASTYSGSYLNSGGMTLLNGGTLPVPYTQSAGTFGLSSNATAGPVTINGGTFAPGNGGTGIGNTGNLSLASGTTYAEVINGPAGASFGNVHVTGTVNLGGSTLTLSGSGAGVAPGTTFTIIDNDGADPVTGTFAGLPNGTVINFGPGGFKYAIAYNGGSGNDVVLTATELSNIPALDPRTLIALAIVLASIAVLALRR